MAQGKLKPLQRLKDLARVVSSGKVPKDWLKYVVPQNLDVSMWIRDFKKRLSQIERFCEKSEW